MKMEKIEHEILVNDYIKVILSSIPKVMTPLDFKALTHKANKLFNIGEVPIVEKRKRFIKAEKETKNNKVMLLNIALSYGGRAEIVQAFKKIIKKKIPPESINEDVISENVWTTDLDLIIRTGKEQRLSNFLIWQAAYSELHFFKKYWPDFTENDLDKALKEYSWRQRRFGK